MDAFSTYSNRTNKTPENKATSSNRSHLIKPKKIDSRRMSKNLEYTRKIYMNEVLLDYRIYLSILKAKKSIIKFSLAQGVLELAFYIIVIIDVN
jgi:hypothetical protein